jgi:hypothetical protein
MRLTFDCAVIDAQSYLDGARELTLEGEAADQSGEHPWLITLTLRWPKDEAPDEADVSLTRADGAALYAGLQDGTIVESSDDSGDTLLELALTFRIASGEGRLAESSGELRLEGTIAGSDATLVVLAPLP